MEDLDLTISVEFGCDREIFPDLRRGKWILCGSDGRFNYTCGLSDKGIVLILVKGHGICGSDK